MPLTGLLRVCACTWQMEGETLQWLSQGTLGPDLVLKGLQLILSVEER